MKKLFYPRSVAVFGVSDSETNLAREIVYNLIRSQFQGAVYPIGRDAGAVEGREILKGLDEIKDVPDVAIMLMPARAIPEAMDACGRKGIRHAVILSGGFGEFGGKGRDIEQQTREMADRWGIRFVGPNCIGIANMENAFVSFFVPFDIRRRKRGGVSMISQSGGVVIDGVRLFTRDAIGINKLISMGNKLSLNECDYLEFLISDPETKTVVLYLENIADGRRLMEIASRTDKPIIMLKSNRSSTSNQIARFHTSALAGDDAVADFAFRQAGIHRVEGMQEMLDLIKIFSLPLLKGNNLAVFGRSGGQAVLIADAVHQQGLNLARLSDEFFDLVKQGVRAGVIRMTNPLDLGDVYDVVFYEELMEKALQEPGVDGLVVNHLYVIDTEIEPSKVIIKAAKRLSDRYGKPIVFCMIFDHRDAHQIDQETDFPVFTDVGHAMKALAVSRQHQPFLERRAGGPAFKKLALAGRRKKRITLEDSGGIFRVLETYRVRPVDYAVVATGKDALAQARKLGYPVALKTASAKIIHKTEAGGVMLGIKDAAGLRKAFRTMAGKLAKIEKEDGKFIVQQMAPPGLEVFIGGRQDPEFGPVILFGLGGIFVEVLKDVVMRVAPVDVQTAQGMIEEIKGAALLKGFRGQPPFDTAALAKCMVNASRLLAEHPEIENLDINPLIVYEKGKGCLAVDAKMDIGSKF